MPQDCLFVEHIQLMNDNNEQLRRRLFIGIGTIINDAIEFVLVNSITSSGSYFVPSTAEFW